MTHSAMITFQVMFFCVHFAVLCMCKGNVSIYVCNLCVASIHTLCICSQQKKFADCTKTLLLSGRLVTKYIISILTILCSIKVICSWAFVHLTYLKLFTSKMLILSIHLQTTIRIRSFQLKNETKN